MKRAEVNWFTITWDLFFTKLLPIHSFVRNFFLNFPFYFANSLFFRELTLNSLFSLNSLFNSLSISRIRLNSLSFSRIHFEITLNQQSSIWIPYKLWIHFKFTICFANSPSINYRFRVSTLNSLFVSQIDNLLYEFTLNLLFFLDFTLNSQSTLRIHFEFYIFFVNSFSVHLLFREFTI